MSFGGGGNSPLTNHVHDNNPGEGGALSTTLTDNTTQVATNTANIAALTANIGKWSATNTATFRTSVIAGAQAGVIEEVT